MAAINNRVFESVYSGLMSSFRKLKNVEEDKDVRNLIYQRLLMDNGISDGELQVEVQKKYGDRYHGMALNDWRHIIEDYTPMVREAVRTHAKEISMLPNQMDMAAEEREEREER